MRKTLLVLAAVMITFSGFANEEEVVEQAKGISTSISIGAAKVDGNKETMQANAAIIIEGEKEMLGSFRAGVEANYGEITVDEIDETTVDNTRGYANLKKTLSEKTFAYIDGSTIRDAVAEIDYRAILGAGLGVYIVKNDKVSLFAELGPSYIWDDVADVKDDYFAYRVAQRITYKLSEKSKVWQSVEYVPEASDAENYLINSEIGAEAALNSLLNLRIVIQDKYDSQPGKDPDTDLDLEKNDITMIAGVSINL